MILKKMHFIDGGVGYSYLLTIINKPILHMHDDKKMVYIISESISASQTEYDRIADHEVGKTLRKTSPFSIGKGIAKIVTHFN